MDSWIKSSVTSHECFNAHRANCVCQFDELNRLVYHDGCNRSHHLCTIHERESPWTDWEPELRSREPSALSTARQRLGDRIAFHAFCQLLFFEQWAALRQRDDLGARGKSGLDKVARNRRGIVVAVGYAREETRWIFRKDGSHRVRDDGGKFVLFDPVPHAEQKPAARLQDPERLAIAGRFVGKEHDPELTHDGIERRIRERQRRGVGLAPRDPFRARAPSFETTANLRPAGRLRPRATAYPGASQ